MRLFGFFEWRRISPGMVPRGALLGLIVALTACATHRGDPPKCKGPFTPINQPGVSDGSQR